MSATIAPTTTDERLDALATRLDEVSAELRAQRAQREMIGELLGDLAHVAGPAMQLAGTRLQEAQDAGLIDFVRHSGGIFSRVAEEFDADDVDALADNIVLILQTVREMTQPEIMTLVRRTAHTVGESVDTPVETPGLMRLMGELREPEVRRGFERLLALLRSMGEEG